MVYTEQYDMNMIMKAQFATNWVCECVLPSLPFWHQSRVFLRNWLNCGDQAIFAGGKNCLAGSKRKTIKIMILGPRINRFEIRQELKIKSSQAIAGRD